MEFDDRKEVELFQDQRMTIRRLIDEGQVPSFYVVDGKSHLSLVAKGLVDIEDISKIPHIEDLAYLNLAFNNLGYVDGTYFDALEKLENLNLGRTCLRILDEDSFSKLNNLKGLCLRYNELTWIESCWFDLESLERLDLTGNHIECISSEGLKVSTLKELILDDNPITKFNPRVVAHTPQLQPISLRNNKMDYPTMKNICAALRSLNPQLKICADYKDLSDYSPMYYAPFKEMENEFGFLKNHYV